MLHVLRIRRIITLFLVSLDGKLSKRIYCIGREPQGSGASANMSVTLNCCNAIEKICVGVAVKESLAKSGNRSSWLQDWRSGHTEAKV